MRYREALLDDIPQLMEIRFSVTENVLSNPDLVTAAACAEYLTRRGKGWVCETADGWLLGFAIADVVGHNIWALFVRPGYEGRGIGRQLQQLMLDWYFRQTAETVWLGTGPGTRAEAFYRHTGWRETGQHGREVKFELKCEEWQGLGR
ncbi:GNAT family N-acetyltransferase [Hymenobacter terricola]|uniref:GNAT family N-acetyltransferase n=1 Tax=Hymenobacter terricola TaxID=2819236 RepID=UPI001B3034CD|nr:GNAT family N-acetyltransferase [Hymenobacter terricola]